MRLRSFKSVGLAALVCILLAQPGMTTPPAVGATLHEDNSETMSQFYVALEKVIADSSGDVAGMLRGFIQRHPGFGPAYLKLFEHHLYLGSLSEAEVFFQKLAQEMRHRRNSCWMLAKIAEARNEPHKARQAFVQAIQVSPAPVPELLTDFLLFDHKNFNDYDVPEFKRELNLEQESRALADALHTFLNLDFAPAARLFEQLPESTLRQPAILYNIGYCYYRQRHNDTAESWWRKGLELARRIGDRKNEAKFLMVIGILKRNSVEPDAALAFYDAAAAIARRIDDLSSLEYLSGNRAIIHRERGEYAEAQTLFRQAISYSERLKSDWKLSVWYSHLGQLFFDKQQYDDALKCYDLSLRSAQSSNNNQKLIEALLNKADINKIAGQTGIAEKLYTQAFEISTNKNIVDFVCRAREGLADIYLSEGRHGEARAAYGELLDSPLFVEGYLRRRAFWHFQIAQSYFLTEAYAEAKTHLDRAYALAQSSESRNLALWTRILLGRTAFLEGKLKDAEQHYLAALHKTEPENTDATSAIWVGRGRLYAKRGDVRKAIRYFEQAARVIEKTRAGLVNQQFRVAYFVDASQVYEHIIDCYSQLYITSGGKDLLDSLYAYLELTRGRTLRELRRQRMATRARQGEAEDMLNYKQLCRNLERKQRMLREKAQTTMNDSVLSNLRAEIEISRMALIEQRLRLADATGAGLAQKSSRELTLGALAKNIDHHETVLLYYLSESTAFVLAVNAQGKKLIQLPTTEQEIKAAVDDFIRPFHDFTRDDFHRTGFRADIAFSLYEKLFAPVEAAVNLAENIVIVPDLSLTNLPLEMLLTRRPVQPVFTPTDKPVYAQDFLQNRYAFTYNPSSLLLKRDAVWRWQRPSFAVFADPLTQISQFTKQTEEDTAPLPDSLELVYTDPATRTRQFDFRMDVSPEPLPFSGVEAARIAETAPWCKRFERETATEASVLKALDSDILHFATHGFVDASYDAFSGLVLSIGQDTINDGFLMGYEIAGFDLNADLVALSACETGRGKPVAGEGALGLPRLFLAAGANSVMMTRWRIVDLVSSQLMPDFYELYLGKGLSKSEALATAKRKILSESRPFDGLHYQHPLFWAAFTLFGAAGERQSDAHGLLIATVAAALACLITMIIRFRQKRV